MGTSYGVGICLQGSFTQKKLEPLVREGLAELSALGVKLSIEHHRKRTLLAQDDGDHSKLWENEDSFFALAGSLAKALGCRAWAISGYAGSSNRLVIQSFSAKGKREWTARDRPAERRFLEEADFEAEPFDLFIKPFLERDPDQWKRVGTIELTEQLALTPVQGKELAAVLGRALPGVKGWVTRQPMVEDIDALHLFLKLSPKLSLEKLGLWEVAFSPPDFSPQEEDDLVKLPDGKSMRGYLNSVRGLASERRGREAVLRWAFKIYGDWLQVSVVEGPYFEDLAELQREERKARAERDADEALERDDPKGLLRAAREGKLELSELVERAGEDKRWKCFDALVKKLPPKLAKEARDGLLSTLEWRDALARGADVNAKVDGLSTLLHRVDDRDEAKALLKAGANLKARSWGGGTPLHSARGPGVAMVLIEAGAPLNVKDKEGRTPLESYVSRIGSAPTNLEVEVITAMVKRGAVRGPALEKLIAPWKNKKTHAAAWQSIAALA